MQVPADRVIALLTEDLADMHRENAILKVQVEILSAQNVAANAAQANPLPLPPVPVSAPAPAPASEDSPLYSALTSEQPAVTPDVTPAPDLAA